MSFQTFRTSNSLGELEYSNLLDAPELHTVQQSIDGSANFLIAGEHW